MKKIIAIMTLSLSCSALSDSSKACQSYQSQIQKYNKLLRRGGSATQMTYWREKVREYMEKARNC